MNKPYYHRRHGKSWLWLIAVTVFPAAGLSLSASAQSEATSGNNHDPHAFRWKIRGSAWFTMMGGDFETRGFFG
ncbi:MAG: hypothetical protein ACU85U_05455 [Gammaproteobacteria bacterium]|jgi:hypothetical protein